MSKKLLDAAKLGKIEDIIKIISSDDDVELEYSDERGYTALLFASIYGNKAMLKTLINAGADVNNSDNNGVTPLMIAVTNYDIDSIALLLDAGASIDKQDMEGNNAVDIARYAGFNDIAYMMIEAKEYKEYEEQEIKRKHIEYYKNKHKNLRSYVKSSIKPHSK